MQSSKLFTCKTHLAENISQDQLNNVNNLIENEKDINFNEVNKGKLNSILENHILVLDMYELNKRIVGMFNNDILDVSVSKNDIENSKEDLEKLKNKDIDIFIDRLSTLLSRAMKQYEIIENARMLVENLFTDNGEVINGVSEIEIEDAKKVVLNVENEEVKKELLKQLKKVDEQIELAIEKSVLDAKIKTEKEEKEKEVFRNKSERDIGAFAGYYISEDNMLCEITSTSSYCFIPFSDVIFEDYFDIIENTGTELTLIVDGEIYTWRLLDSGQTLQAAIELRRLTRDEFDSIRNGDY
ncbi:MAG TPA: hypothetical protein VFF20_11400 [Pseudogracilibacillus sp.]|nr:hypothetical protein [Pseudogracilibacillus sp.]